MLKSGILFSGKLEADDGKLSLVYHYFGEMMKHFEDDRLVLSKVQARWTFIKRDVHALSYLLVPKNAAKDVFFDDKSVAMCAMKKFAARTDPDDDQATMVETVRFVYEMKTLVGDQRELVHNMEAHQYWEIFGKTRYPLLFNCAKKINAMVCSSAASERAWSVFGFIHSQLRNRLSNEKVEKIAFLYINSGFMDEKDKTDYILEDGISLRFEDFEE